MTPERANAIQQQMRELAVMLAEGGGIVTIAVVLTSADGSCTHLFSERGNEEEVAVRHIYTHAAAFRVLSEQMLIPVTQAIGGHHIHSTSLSSGPRL